MPILFILSILFFSFISPALASDHRDAGFTAANPATDITDFYAFRSYETGREGFITVIMNVSPYQQASAGPAYYTLDPTALYDIYVDRNGDAKEDLSFRFRFKETLIGNGVTITVGDKKLNIPFLNNGSFAALNLDDSKRNRQLSYKIELLRKQRAFDYGSQANKIVKGIVVKNANEFSIPEFTPPNNGTFLIPEYNIGSKSITDYDSYANNFIYSLDLGVKKCKEDARVFVGPRKDSFQAKLGGIYDLVNVNLEQAETGATSETASSNVISIALELPISCLDLKTPNTIVSVWGATHVPARIINRHNPILGKARFFSRKDYIQIDRAGHPFVSSMMIGFKDKDLYNSRRVSLDSNGKLSDYINYPTLAELIELNSSLTAPNLFPRTDLNEWFLTGLTGVNQFSSAKAKATDTLKLNTATTIVTKGSQNRLGLLGGDNAGYPNGRRPGDDVTDVFLRVLMGARISDVSLAPSRSAVLTDGVLVNDGLFSDSFPYLASPVAGD